MGAVQHVPGKRAPKPAAPVAAGHAERRRALGLLLDASGFLAFLAVMVILSLLAVLLIGVP